MDQLILLTALEVGFWLLMTVNSQFRLEPFRFEPQLGLNVDRRDLRGFNMTSLPGTIPRLNMSLHVTTISQFYQSFHGPRCGYNDGLGCRCRVAQTCWNHICTTDTGENLLEGLTPRMHVALDFDQSKSKDIPKSIVLETPLRFDDRCTKFPQQLMLPNYMC